MDALAEAVALTLGRRGRTAILERDFGPPQVVNSGVLVAKSIELEDRFENMGAQLLREVAARSSAMAGNSTTTATVLAHGMNKFPRPKGRRIQTAKCKTSTRLASHRLEASAAIRPQQSIFYRLFAL